MKSIWGFIRRLLGWERSSEPVVSSDRESCLFPEPVASQKTKFRRYDLNNYSRPRFYPTTKEPASASDEKRHFFQQVHGIYFRNDDGTSRQDIIRGCIPGEELNLVPEPTNIRDPNAIKVCRPNGEQLGYLPAPRAMRLTAELEMGWTYRITVEEVFAADRRGCYGCKLRFAVLTMSRRTEEREQKRKAKAASATPLELT